MQSILICKVIATAQVSTTLPAPANDNPRSWGVPTRLANDGWWLLAAPPPPPRPAATIHAFPPQPRGTLHDNGGASS
jgi:hypothetical protein